MTNEKPEKEKAAFLVVEPDLGKRNQLRDMLRKLGYDRIDMAPDGAAAFNILKRRPIDCIISAWDMPQMNGLSLLKIVGADDELYHIPFLVITRSIDKEMVMTAGKNGAAAVMLEPITQATLEQKINGILGTPPDANEEQTEKLFKEAKILEQEGLYSKALKIYQQILDIQEDAEVYYNIGNIKTAQGKFDEAIIAYRKAVMINNFHGRAFKMMGKVYLKTGEPEEAEKCFKKAGEIFLERQMDSEAEESFKEVLKLNPSTVAVYNHLGIIYRRQHNIKKAITLYRMALEIEKDDENIYFNLGRALLEDRQVAEAKKMFTDALRLSPDFKEAKKMLEAIKIGGF